MSRSGSGPARSPCSGQRQRPTPGMRASLASWRVATWGLRTRDRTHSCQCGGGGGARGRVGRSTAVGRTARAGPRKGRAGRSGPRRASRSDEPIRARRARHGRCRIASDDERGQGVGGAGRPSRTGRHDRARDDGQCLAGPTAAPQGRRGIPRGAANRPQQRGGATQPGHHRSIESSDGHGSAAAHRSAPTRPHVTGLRGNPAGTAVLDGHRRRALLRSGHRARHARRWTPRAWAGQLRRSIARLRRGPRSPLVAAVCREPGGERDPVPAVSRRASRTVAAAGCPYPGGGRPPCRRCPHRLDARRGHGGHRCCRDSARPLLRCRPRRPASAAHRPRR